jgi:hypothetical protein
VHASAVIGGDDGGGAATPAAVEEIEMLGRRSLAATCMIFRLAVNCVYARKWAAISAAVLAWWVSRHSCGDHRALVTRPE